MGVEKVAFPREFFFVPERTDLNRTDRFERARSFWGFQSFRLLDTSHLFLSQNFPNGVSCSGKSGMNFPEHGTAGWGSGKSEKVSGCSKLPPETSRTHVHNDLQVAFHTPTNGCCISIKFNPNVVVVCRCGLRARVKGLISCYGIESHCCSCFVCC